MKVHQMCRDCKIKETGVDKPPKLVNIFSNLVRPSEVIVLELEYLENRYLDSSMAY